MNQLGSSCKINHSPSVSGFQTSQRFFPHLIAVLALTVTPHAHYARYGSSGFGFISTARRRAARPSSVTLLMTAVGFVFSRASGVAQGMAKPFCQLRHRFGPDSEYHMKKLLDRWELNVAPTFLDRLD